MESDFLFFLQDQVALVGPDATERVHPTGQYSHAPVYTSYSVIERECDE